MLTVHRYLAQRLPCIRTCAISCSEVHQAFSHCQLVRIAFTAVAQDTALASAANPQTLKNNQPVTCQAKQVSLAYCQMSVIVCTDVSLQRWLAMHMVWYPCISEPKTLALALETFAYYAESTTWHRSVNVHSLLNIQQCNQATGIIDHDLLPPQSEKVLAKHADMLWADIHSDQLTIELHLQGNL